MFPIKKYNPLLLQSLVYPS